MVKIFYFVKNKPLYIFFIIKKNLGHNWGAFFTHLVDVNYPKHFDKLVTIDVSTTLDTSFSAILHTLFYQGFNISTFAINLVWPSLGDFMS